MFHVKVFSSEAALYQAAFQRFCVLMERTNHPVLGLATGSTPLHLYELMVQACRRGELSFRSTVTFNLDEYVGLSKEHPQSYHYFMEQNLFSGIDIAPENVHIPTGDGTSADPCGDYERELAKYQIDLQLLGIGSNGHIAFNEPGTALGSRTHVVQLQPSTLRDNVRFFAGMEEVPTRAITMGIRSILQARSIMLIAAGRNKAEAVREMLSGEVSAACPASSLQLHPDVTVLLDADAAGLLPAYSAVG